MIRQLSEDLKARKVTSRDLVAASFDRIRGVDGKVNAFLSTLEDRALAQATAVDAQLDNGDVLGPLAGIPIAVKDNICIKGELTTCSSKILEGYRSVFDATVIERTNAAGLIPIGKVNLDEFAMGSSTENSAFGTTLNPWDLDRVPGGSSGGSAAAVAAGFAPLALGSDTGGSIRQPAAFCGITGMKPSYGRVSRFGLVAFASSLDQIGPMAWSVEDCAFLLNAICGFDPNDSTSVNEPVPDFTNGLDQDIKGLKIGVPKQLFDDTVSDDVRARVNEALDVLTQEGATWELFDFDSLRAAVSVYYIIAPAEASANLARFDGVRYGFRAENAKNLKDMYLNTRGEGFGDEVKRRIILGTYVLSSGYYDAYYLKAQKVQATIRAKFDDVFSKYDVIMSPTTPAPAFKVGEVEDPLQMYLADILTIPANLAGLPGLSVPCGFSDGLPVGLQIVGKRFDEATVLRVGHRYQMRTDFHTKRPELEGVTA